MAHVPQAGRTIRLYCTTHAGQQLPILSLSYLALTSLREAAGLTYPGPQSPSQETAEQSPDPDIPEGPELIRKAGLPSPESA